MSLASSSLVQKIEELLYPANWCHAAVADVDDPITVALHRSRSGFPKASRQECRRYSIRPDIKPYDSPSPAVDPKPRCGKEIASRWRQFAKSKQRFILEVFQFVFTSAAGGASVCFQPNCL